MLFVCEFSIRKSCTSYHTFLIIDNDARRDQIVECVLHTNY